MKLQILSEALGVPENILETSQRIYFDILNLLSKEIDSSQTNYTFHLSPNEPYLIGDIKTNKCEITITVDIDPYWESVIAYRYSMHDSFDLISNTKDIWMKSSKTTTSPIEISIHFGVPNNESIPKIIDFIVDNKISVISTLSHELKHFYDRVKVPNINVHSFMKYQSTNEMLSTGLEAIDNFMFSLYYISNFEALVRSTEVYSELKQRNITQKEFLNAIQQNDTFIKLKQIRDYSMDDFLNELESESEKIKKLYSSEIGTPLSELGINSNRELILDFLPRLIGVIHKKYITSVENIMYPNKFFLFLGIGGKDDNLRRKKISKIINQANNYVNNEISWFEKNIKMMQSEANKAIKKISKIYAMLDNSNTNTNESIIDPKGFSRVNGYDVKIQELIKDAIKNRQEK